LTISSGSLKNGNSVSENEVHKVKFHKTEDVFHYPLLKEAFSLPETVKYRKDEASYEDGILKVFKLSKKGRKPYPKAKRMMRIKLGASTNLLLARYFHIVGLDGLWKAVLISE